jgi:NADH-quinone oxidoreductase subunit A
MNTLILSPPIAFIISLLLALYLSYVLSKLAFQEKDRPKGQGKSYACGENIPDQMMEVDYSQFFPFAFYFTILHVVALMLATVPAVKGAVLSIALIYIIGAIIGLLVLYRR